MENKVTLSNKKSPRYVSRNDLIQHYNKWLLNNSIYSSNNKTSNHLCYNQHHQAIMCQPQLETISLHQRVEISVEAPLSINLTEGYMVDVRKGLLKYRKKSRKDRGKNGRTRNNFTKLKQRRWLFPDQAGLQHSSRHLTDPHHNTHPTCWLFSSLFPSPVSKFKFFQTQANQIKNAEYFERRFEHSKKSNFNFKNLIPERTRKITDKNEGETSSIHEHFRHFNYTNVNLTVRLDKKFELSRISMSLCDLPGDTHVSLYKSSRGGRSLTPLHHFSHACASILAREPASKHPVKSLRVMCSAWPLRYKCAQTRSKSRKKNEKDDYKLLRHYKSNLVKLQNSKYLVNEVNKTKLNFALINDIPTDFDFDRGSEDVGHLNDCNNEDSLVENGKVCSFKCCRIEKSGEKICQKCFSKSNRKHQSNTLKMNYKNHPGSPPRHHKQPHKRRTWNSNALLPNNLNNLTNPTSGMFYWNYRQEQKLPKKCKSMKITFDFLKGSLFKGDNDPLTRDWVTASEVVVAIYFSERLDKVQNSVASWARTYSSPSSSTSSSSSKPSVSNLPNLKIGEISKNHETRYRPETKEIVKINILSIGDLLVAGRCKCNGHASKCVKNSMGRLVCQCQHNTYGDECEKCRPFYQNLPWKRATKGEASVCEACECNRHTRRCRFSRELYEMSSRKGGSTCIRCGHNTAGRHCHYCRAGYRRHPARPIWHRSACIKCNCHVLGSKGSWCEPSTGQCVCKEGVGGLRCHTCLHGYHQDRSPIHPCVRNQDNRTDDLKNDQHKKRNTDKSIGFEKNSLVCKECTPKTRLKLEIFCQSKYVMKATLERVERKERWAWLGLFIEHSYKHREGKVQRKRGEALMKRDLYDCNCPIKFKLNQTYLILSRSQKEILNPHSGDLIDDENSEEFKPSRLFSSSEIEFPSLETLPDNPVVKTNRQEAIPNDARSLTPSPKPFDITEADTVLEWRESMAASLIRMVRNQQRGSCGGML